MINIHETIIEIPGGLIDKNETPEASGKKRIKRRDRL